MSYGWLTESALLPKQSKTINIESRTFVDLKVNLLKEKEKLKSDSLNHLKTNFKRSKLKFEEVYTFQEKPRQIIPTEDDPLEDYDSFKEKLKNKEMLYEKLQKVKDLNEEENRIKSNSSVNFEIMRTRKNKREDRPDTMEIEHRDVPKITPHKKVLSENEKIALEEVIEEELNYKDKLQLLKRKKTRERKDRLERIKKMKIEN
jgi:hypothetical protein